MRPTSIVCWPEGQALTGDMRGLIEEETSMVHSNIGQPGQAEEGRGCGAPRRSRQVILLTLVLQAWAWPCPGETPSGRALDGTATPTPTRWTSLGLGGGGAMYTPAISPVDPNLILLGCDMSGAYRTTDGGQNWEMIHYQQLNGSTTVRPAWHPADPNIAYAADGWRGPLKMTRDKGKTWASVPGAPIGVSAIGVDPGNPDLFLVGSRRGLGRSSDGGKTWANVGPVHGRLLGFHFDRSSAADRRVCFAATDQAVFRSDDGGATWHETASQPGAGSVLSFAGASSEAGKICVLYCSVTGRAQSENATGGIYRSDDRGATWVKAMGKGIDPASGRDARYEFLLASDASPSRVYATRGHDGQVFRSDDRGALWRPILFTAMRCRGSMWDRAT